MKNRDDALFRRILKYCIETEAAINLFGDDQNEFAKNSVFRNAACMPIMQIGELCKLVSDETRICHTEIDWKGWCGVRDIIAHQYTNLDIEKTWGIIKKDIPKMKQQVSDIMSDVDANGIERIEGVLNNHGMDSKDASALYHKIVDDTGVSLNAFSDEKIIEYIHEFIVCSGD